MERKIGEGHVSAMARLGLKELRNLLNPSRESVADTEIGLVGTLTQGEIAEARGGPGQGRTGGIARTHTAALDDLRAFAHRNSRGPEDRDRDQGKPAILARRSRKVIGTPTLADEDRHLAVATIALRIKGATQGVRRRRRARGAKPWHGELGWDMTLEQRLENIEAMLLVLCERQKAREWHTTHEFAKTVGRAEFTIREYCRRGRLHSRKRHSGRAANIANG